LAKLLPLDVSPPVRLPPVTPPPVQARAMADIKGLYSVAGPTESGRRYTGQVTIRGGADAARVEWRLTNGSNYVGQGSMNRDIVPIDWGSAHPVVYRLEPATGVLRGTWANGRATDVLTYLAAQGRCQIPGKRWRGGFS
jgi:hypothetical protein